MFQCGTLEHMEQVEHYFVKMTNWFPFAIRESRMSVAGHILPLTKSPNCKDGKPLLTVV